MRSLRHRLSVLACVFVLLSQTFAFTAQAPSAPSATPATPANSTKPKKPDYTNNGTYVNSKGQTVQRPENCASAPQGATALCRDGTYSFSRSRRGTCSHHGGVAKWL